MSFSSRVLAEHVGQRKELRWYLRVQGFFVSGVAWDEEAVRIHIRNQEQEDKCLDQLGLW